MSDITEHDFTPFRKMYQDAIRREYEAIGINASLYKQLDLNNSVAGGRIARQVLAAHKQFETDLRATAHKHQMRNYKSVGTLSPGH